MDLKEKKTKAYTLWGVIMVFFLGFGMVSVGATKFPFSIISDYTRLIDYRVEKAFPFLSPEISTEDLENGIQYMERNDYIKKKIGKVPTHPAEEWYSQKRVELGLNFSDFVPLEKEIKGYVKVNASLRFARIRAGLYSLFISMALFSLLPHSTILWGYRVKIFAYNSIVFFFLFLASMYILSSVDTDVNKFSWVYVLTAPAGILSILFEKLSIPNPDGPLMILNTFVVYWLLSKLLPGIVSIKRLPCPHCDRLIDMKSNWYHFKCDEHQFLNRKVYVTSPHWFKCWHFLDKITCPSCGEEIKL